MAGSQALNFTLIPRSKASIIQQVVLQQVASGLGSGHLSHCTFQSVTCLSICFVMTLKQGFFLYFFCSSPW